MRPALPRTFATQAALILLPVLLLATYGLWALGKERAALEEEIRERSSATLQLLARELPRAFDEAVNAYVEGDGLYHAQVRKDAGQFIPNPVFRRSPGIPENEIAAKLASWRALHGDFPFADHPAADWYVADRWPRDDGWKTGVPEVPAWFRELPEDQFKDWQAIEHAAAVGQRDEALRLINEFIVGPIDTFAEHNAQFLLRRMEHAGVQDWLQNAWEYSSVDVATPSGLPLSGLALLRALDLNATNRFDDTFKAVLAMWFDQPPSVMTAPLMARVVVLTPTDDSEAMARLDALQTLARRQRQITLQRDRLIPDPEKTPPALTWIDVEGREYFISCGLATDQDNLHILGTTVPSTWLLPRFQKSVADVAALLPEFVSLHLELAGRSIPLRSGIDATPESAVLARENFVLTTSDNADRTEPVVTLEARLASPTAMYRLHARRVWMTGGLIVLAVLAAAFGLWQTLCTLRRQLALNELKTNFVSSVSHELRAPIASVRLMAENLSQRKVTGEAKTAEYSRLIEQECRRLSGLIENVLDYSRIEQGRKQYDLEPTDLGALVEETVRLMKPYAGERGVALRLECEANVAEHPGSIPQFELNLDGRAIQQALINLIDNAVKHSPANAAVVVRLDRSANDMLRLVVEDCGPGIPADERERIFDRFYRRGSELRRETPGIGIGLSIVRHIVEAHGGRVWMEDVASHGSRFIIELNADN